MKYNPKVVLAYFKSEGIPEPVLEYRFCNRLWRFDFAWTYERVALEVEGGIWTGGRHGRGSGIAKDIEKYNRAAILGWKVLRVEPRKLCTSGTAGMVREALYGAIEL